MDEKRRGERPIKVNKDKPRGKVRGEGRPPKGNRRKSIGKGNG